MLFRSDKNENEVSQEGDMIVFDYKATIENKIFEGGEGKNTQIILGKDLFIKGFDKQLIGCKKKQEKETRQKPVVRLLEKKEGAPLLNLSQC